MGNAFFIVWRETIEAMLVIGILHGWLSARPEARAGIPWLWGGVAEWASMRPRHISTCCAPLEGVATPAMWLPCMLWTWFCSW